MKSCRRSLRCRALKMYDIDILRNSMKYSFYGSDTAADVKAVRHIYRGIETPLDLYDALSKIWCRDTCAPRMRSSWTTENPTLGQCSITAFLAQDIFGGEVYGLTAKSGDLHCYNVVDGHTFDLSSEQFKEAAKDLVYTGNPLQDRESGAHFFKEEKRRRYEYLKSRLAEECS